MARPPALALVGLAALFALSARADDVLHEYVPDIDPDEAALALAQHSGGPSATVDDGQLAPATHDAPPMVATPGDGMLGEQPGQRSPTFRPDRQTQLEDSLEYYAVFTPSIAPFKRVTSLDATLLGQDRKTPVLGIHDSRRRRVKVENASARPADARPRDRFLGEVKLDFSRGRVLPLPSVSPESRILSLRSEPAMDLTIERDGADNFFAVARGRAPAGEVLVSFETDAPRSYFGAALPHGPVDALAREVPPLDRGIRTRALGFARQLGIGLGSDVAMALSTLTAHFRAFEESAQPPTDSGDLYLDLVREKKGICRHRAYGFVVTAHALGIPARFVQNEAHSWVEVELERIGWMRIDLGGAAHGLTAHGMSDRPLYQPAEPDPLPRPAAYEASYSLLGRDVKGLRRPDDEQLLGRWVKPDEQSPAAQAQGRTSFMAGPSDRAQRDTSGRAQLRVLLDQRHLSALRGTELSVSGRVQNTRGEGVAGLRIEVSLAAEARRERMLLGVTQSSARGNFAGAFAIPPDLAAGDYKLVVVTPGNGSYLPAIAE